MQLDRPKIETPGVVLTARDKNDGKSKSITIYNATPEQVMQEFQKYLASKDRRASREPSHAA